MGPSAHGYREWRPSAALAPLVECLWSDVRPACATAASARVLPDGCVDILLDLAAPTPAALVIGTMTRPLLVERVRATHLVAVRFRPGAAAAFLRAPIDALTDRVVAIDELWRGERDLAECVGAHPELAAQIAALDARLCAALGRLAPLDARVEHALAALEREPVSVDELARRVGLTRQHLARRFRAAVGVSPKRFVRILRLRRAASALARGERDLATTAVTGGYCDQAHMTNEFRALAGVTPRRWAAEVAGQA